MATTVRDWEAWRIETLPDGTREVVDQCGHSHETLAMAREEHKMSRHFNVIVGIDYHEDGESDVAQEYRHNPRRPHGFGGLIFDMVNR